jgi:hypothetical protein
MGPFSGAYAAGFFSLAEKSSLEKNLGPFCCHKNTSFCMTCNKKFFQKVRYLNLVLIYTPNKEAHSHSRIFVTGGSVIA